MTFYIVMMIGDQAILMTARALRKVQRAQQRQQTDLSRMPALLDASVQAFEQLPKEREKEPSKLLQSAWHHMGYL